MGRALVSWQAMTGSRLAGMSAVTPSPALTAASTPMRLLLSNANCQRRSARREGARVREQPHRQWISRYVDTLADRPNQRAARRPARRARNIVDLFEDDLDAARVVGLPHRSVGDDEHLQRGAGVQAGEVGEGLGKLGRSKVFMQADAAVPGQRASGLGEGLRGQREDALGVRQQFLARPGERDARRRPVQQRTADGPLELAQLLAERGLGVAERRRGATDAARSRGGDERAKQYGLKILGDKSSLCQVQLSSRFLWRDG